MIICVYINPTIDKTVYLKKFAEGGTNRPDKVVIEGAGKAVNTAVVLKELGENVKVMGLLYEDDGMLVKRRLEAKSIFYDFDEQPGVSRMNTKIFDQEKAQITEINEAGAPVSKELMARIADEVVKVADKKDTVVLAGALPPECSKDFYANIIMRLKEKGVKCVLDTSGDALALGVAQKPYLIKPNLEELKELVKIDGDSLEEIVKACEKLIEDGVQNVAVSMGKNGALLITKDGAWHAKAPKVDVLSTVGAGDSMVAGLVNGLEVSAEEALKRGAAAAAGSITLEGTKLCTKDLFDKYYEKIVITPIPLKK